MQIILEKIPENEGGGWVAYRVGFQYYLQGDGENAGEALRDLLGKVDEEEEEE
jgi:hypothetical protein